MKKLFIISLLYWITSFTYGGNLSTGYAVLQKLGFENIRLRQFGGATYVALEDNIYRGTFRGLGVALQALNEDEIAADSIILVALENKIPRLCVCAIKGMDSWSVTVNYKTDYPMRMLKEAIIVNPSTWKTDIVLYPQVMLDNHQFNHLFNAAVDIAPAIEMGLWRGAEFTAQVVFPIWNNFKGEYDYIRPGIIRLKQNLFSTDKWFASTSLGVFNNGRLGIHAEVYRHLSKRLDIGLLAGYTGDWYMDDGDLMLCYWDKVNILARATYYEPISSLQVEVTGGRFVYGDYGVRGDCTRHFGEYAIGIYGIYTGGEHNAGFHFAIPFGPKRVSRKHPVRVRLPEYFDWEYSMVSFYDYVDENRGCLYETEPDQNHSAHYWQPEYVRVYLTKFLNARID